MQGNQTTAERNDDETDDDDDQEDEEEDSAVEMGPAPARLQSISGRDTDECGGRGGSVDSIDTLSSSADHTDTHTSSGVSNANEHRYTSHLTND